jgi:3-isopropylmalate dehydrogenase
VAGPTTATALTRDPGWVARIRDPLAPDRAESPLIGALAGEGIGPEVMEAALTTLRALERAGGGPVTVETGGSIGLTAERETGAPLSDGVASFCADVFERGGAVLSGPGSGRYVYDLRRRLGLFFKISPIQLRNGLARASSLKPELVDGLDLLVVRENLGGIYQGTSQEVAAADGERLVEHRFSYAEPEVRRFVEAAARLARSRRGQLTVVVKQGGLPRLSALWRDCSEDVCRSHGVDCSFVDVDLMAYRLVHDPRAFDVIAAPNLFGDVLGDLAAVALGSRGLAYGASYNERGDGVYQTNHGAAYDISGSDRANPVGQILSLAMLLRESLGLGREARALEAGVRAVWSDGGTTADLGGRLGTAEMAARVGAAAAESMAASPE